MSLHIELSLVCVNIYEVHSCIHMQVGGMRVTHNSVRILMVSYIGLHHSVLTVCSMVIVAILLLASACKHASQVVDEVVVVPLV